MDGNDTVTSFTVQTHRKMKKQPLKTIAKIEAKYFKVAYLPDGRITLKKVSRETGAEIGGLSIFTSATKALRCIS